MPAETTEGAEAAVSPVRSTDRLVLEALLLSALASLSALAFETACILLFRGLAVVPPAEIVFFHLAISLVPAFVVVLTGRYDRDQDRALAARVVSWSPAVTLLLLYIYPALRAIATRALSLIDTVPVATGVALAALLAFYYFSMRVAAVGTTPALGLVSGSFLLASLLAWGSLSPHGAGVVGVPTFAVASFVVFTVILAVFRERLPKGRGVVASMCGLGLFAATGLLCLLSARTWSDRSVRQLADTSSEIQNVLLIVLDTMRKDVFDYMLQSTAEGRELQRELGDVVWFDQHTTVGPSTPPTMATIFSGLSPMEHGIDGSLSPNWRLSLRESTALLPETLQGAGVQTLAAVTNSTLGNSIGLERGWSQFDGLRPTRENYLAARPIVGSYASQPFMSARAARKAAVHMLKRFHRRGAPTFLWFHLMDTHKPVANHLRPGEPLPEEGRDLVLYQAAARYQAGEVATAIRAFRRYLPQESTLLVLLSDHGEMLATDGHRAPGYDRGGPRGFHGDPLDSGHAHNYFESVVRGLLAIRVPGQPSGTARVGDLTSQLDILPTLVEALGIDWEQETRGCSLVPYLRQETPDPCHEVVVISANDYGPRHKALRTPRLKVMVPDEAGAFDPLLFDLLQDPREGRNLAQERSDDLSAAMAVLQRHEQDSQSAPGQERELSREAIERLRALGYIQ